MPTFHTDQTNVKVTSLAVPDLSLFWFWWGQQDVLTGQFSSEFLRRSCLSHLQGASVRRVLSGVSLHAEMLRRSLYVCVKVARVRDSGSQSALIYQSSFVSSSLREPYETKYRKKKQVCLFLSCLCWNQSTVPAVSCFPARGLLSQSVRLEKCSFPQQTNSHLLLEGERGMMLIDVSKDGICRELDRIRGSV